jgi:deazaflavin-dependent oxidoreductase (nitroreductase family)
MSENFKFDGPDSQKRHLEVYLETDGRLGHLVDSNRGPPVPCLILETTGRKSGTPKMLPLIYGKDSENFIVVASKGGAPKHPAWFLNLEADGQVKFQVADKKYCGKAVVAPQADRRRLYEMMAKIHPPYLEYEKRTEREIPVILLQPEAEIDRL